MRCDLVSREAAVPSFRETQLRAYHRRRRPSDAASAVSSYLQETFGHLINRCLAAHRVRRIRAPAVRVCPEGAPFLLLTAERLLSSGSTRSSCSRQQPRSRLLLCRRRRLPGVDETTGNNVET